MFNLASTLFSKSASTSMVDIIAELSEDLTNLNLMHIIKLKII